MATANATDDNSDEWAEEEQLVLVELSGIIDSDFLSQERKECKLLGVDTDQPVLQLDRYVFTGEYNDTIGTAVIFEEDDPIRGEDSSKKVKYFCHTFKKLQMNRAFLSAKSAGSTSTSNISANSTKSTPAAMTTSSGDIGIEIDEADMPSTTTERGTPNLATLVSQYDFIPKDTETEPDDETKT